MALRKHHILIAALLFMAATACAAEAEPAATNAVPDIEVKADQLDFDRGRGIMKAAGNVLVTRGSESLRAESVTVKTDSRELWASGGVTFMQGGRKWQGEKLYVNFATGQALSETDSSFVEKPFRIWMKDARRTGKGGQLVGNDAVLTTCRKGRDDSHYRVRASEVTINPGEDIIAKHVRLYMWKVPILYFPYWREDEEGYGLHIKPGYSSRLGAYLLNSYGFRLTDSIRGRTHFDYRTKRGFAVGQEFTMKNDKSSGLITAYYANDDNPVDSDEDSPVGSIDSDRYRLRLSHKYTFGRRTYAQSRLHYLSDTDVLEDFFRSEYKREPKPENYVSIRHNDPRYSAGLTTRIGLNDFYDVTERMPEAEVTLYRTQIGNTRVFYNGSLAGGYLTRSWQESSANKDYDSVRIDSPNTISLSRKIGFLNVVPRAELRMTYYSITPEEQDGVSVTGEVPETVTVDGSGDLRAMYELGLEASFKAFKLLVEPNGNEGGLRHVVEPYARYTYVQEPNLVPDELYQFDEVDALDEQHIIRFGIRNKLQTKRKKGSRDILDLDIWADSDLNAGGDTDSFDSIEVDAELRLLTKLSLDFDAEIDFDDGVTEANTHIILGRKKRAHADIEYRYTEDSNNLLLADLSTDAKKPWSYAYDMRYDFDMGRMEEQVVWLRRSLDCMNLSLGFSHLPDYVRSDGTERDEEYRVLFKLWIKAFPKSGFAID